MRFVFRPTGVVMARVLVVESGPRALTERFLKHLYSVHPAERVDLLTCFEGQPASLDTGRGKVITIHSHRSITARRALIRQLARSGYDVVAIVCAGQAIMARWKWAVALLVPAKVLIVNENADYFWLDSGNLGNIRAIVSHRMNWRVAASPQLVLELIAYPFVILYLLAYAGWIHGRRLLRHVVHKGT